MVKSKLTTIPVLRYNETYWLPIALEDMKAGSLVWLQPYGFEDYGASVARSGIMAQGTSGEDVKKEGYAKSSRPIAIMKAAG